MLPLLDFLQPQYLVISMMVDGISQIYLSKSIRIFLKIFVMLHSRFLLVILLFVGFCLMVFYPVIWPMVIWGIHNLLNWYKSLWRHFLLPSWSFLIWRLLHGCLPTGDLLRKWGFSLPSRCSLCAISKKNMEHLFLHCAFARELWRAFGNFFEVDIAWKPLPTFIRDAFLLRFSSQVQRLWWVGVSAVNLENLDDDKCCYI